MRLPLFVLCASFFALSPVTAAAPSVPQVVQRISLHDGGRPGVVPGSVELLVVR